MLRRFTSSSVARTSSTTTALLQQQQRNVTKYAEFNVDDPLELEQELTDIERQVYNSVKSYCNDVLSKRVLKKFRLEEADREFFYDCGKLGIMGPTIEGYGCPGVSSVAAGLISRAIESVDSGYRSYWSVQSSLVMHPINEYGSTEQKERFLPKLATGEYVGCFGLTEPNAGSDPAGMQTIAKKTAGGYVLNGSKLWITSSPIADVAIIWAKLENHQGPVQGFIVERSMKGFETPKIEGKLSLRASTTGGIQLTDVFVPDANVLPEGKGLKAPFGCLSSARYGIAWGALGAAETCFKVAREYTIDRKMFGRPLAQNQLIQDKLANMSTDITLGLNACLRAGRLKDEGKLSHQVISMLKRNNTKKAIEIARTARDMLGGNGIVDEYVVMRHMVNLESVITYEGTYDMHGLILGRAITGLSAF
jgi:glutaryl-CoA dehydrogenase